MNLFLRISTWLAGKDAAKDLERGRHKPILSVDFDGVLHAYDTGWKGVSVIPDGPVHGAMAFLREAVTRFDVQIYSSRSRYLIGRTAMRTAVRQWLTDELGDMGEAVFDELKWPIFKPSAFITLDDRAITFTGRFPDTGELAGFKPWNKGGSRAQ